jgi:hypothetical protein
MKRAGPKTLGELPAPLQSTLLFIYDWIKKYGRVPENKELCLGFGIRPAEVCRRIDQLTAYGWVKRSEAHGANKYWPVGVTRTITFEPPATQLIGNGVVTAVVAHEVPEAGAAPIGSTERLKQIAVSCGLLFGLHPHDVETIRQCAERLEQMQVTFTVIQNTLRCYEKNSTSTAE